MTRSAPPLHRRQWLRSALGAAALGTTLLATGCGFKLRGQQAMAFKTIELSGFAGNSLMANELARALELNGVRVVSSTLEATQLADSTTVPTSHVVLKAIDETRNMVATSTTAYRQVRTMNARIKLRFEVRRGDGTLIVPASDISLANDLTYDEKDALAKQDEAAALQKSMQTDIVNQVIRRLGAIRADQLPTPVAPAATGASSVSATELDRRVNPPATPSRDSAR